MLGVQVAARQGSVAASVPNKSGKRNTQPNRRLYPVEQYRGSELPRFGMSTKPGKAVRIGRWGGMRRTGSVRPPFESAMGGCNLSMCSSADSRGICKMGSLLVPRRQFLRGIGSLVVCAPAVVRSPSLMRISARFCVSGRPLPPWAITQDALALLQHEMERRFAEKLFGQDSRPAGAENAVLPRSPVVADAKITALWELRTWFGPRGSPPKPFEDLPAEVRAGLLSMFGACPDAGSGPRAARFSSVAARESD
jgi:hypothetical protein